MSIGTKLREQGGVEKPLSSLTCWAEVRVYTGSMFPSFVGCSKAPRKGHLTCHWHRDREEDARSLKEAMSGSNQRTP